MSTKTTAKTKRKNSKGGDRRKRDPHAGLNPRMHPMARREYLDGDYYEKLNDKEKAFMSKFIDEYYGGSLANKDDKVKRKKDLHKTNKLRKECYDRNNARNRDMTILANTRGRMDQLHETATNSEGQNNKRSDNQVEVPRSSPTFHEETINALIDIKDSLPDEK
jgi:hypothetical protein